MGDQWVRERKVGGRLVRRYVKQKGKTVFVPEMFPLFASKSHKQNYSNFAHTAAARKPGEMSEISKSNEYEPF